MTGFVRLDAIDGGVSCEVHLEHVSMFDKASLVASLFQAIDIDASSAEQMATYCALAKMLHESGTTIKANNEMVDALRELAKRKERNAEQEAAE